jgi:hypothetical protein
MKLLKRLEQHQQPEPTGSATGGDPSDFVLIGRVLLGQIACRDDTRKPRVGGALKVRHAWYSERGTGFRVANIALVRQTG